MSDLPLASDFPPASRDHWLARVAAVLKGASFDDRLVSATADGIKIEPLHGMNAGPRSQRDEHGPWQVVQRIDHPDAALANEQALDDLNNGATALGLSISGAASARGFGLRDASVASLARALKDIRLDAIAFRLDAGPQGRTAARNLAELVAGRPVDPARLDVAFGMDPIGVLARRGFLDEPWAARARIFAETVKDLRRRDFRGPFATADGRAWHDGGATEAQELGCALATGVAYLRALNSLNDETLARSVDVILAADQDMFLTMAKFRAMRLLWGRVLDSSGLPPISLQLHGETSWRMMSKRDPHSNILRAVAAVFGAGLGGADSIAVLPFSMAQGLPDAFARRVARNLQNVLLEESNLWRVADPAGGSGYVEHLTEALCNKAWEFFQAIERRGGIAAALESGWLQQEIGRSREALLARGEPIVGSSIHPLAKEIEASIAGDVAVFPERSETAIPMMRLAESYEAAA